MIPYNPSSFNTNKTILEQILELKNWLKEHPSYKVYQCFANYMPNQFTSYAFSQLAGDSQTIEAMAVGDVVFFADSYYAVVTAVDLDNEDFDIQSAVSFKGPQGVQGPAGADGQNGTNGTDGTCIRKYTGNSNANPSTLYAISNLNFSTGLQQYDLIYFNDGYAGFVSNVNVGLSNFQISARFYVNGQNGTDGAYVSNASVDANGDLIITIYDPETSLTSQVNAGYVVGPAGPSNPEGTAVLSTGATSGQVLTADGIGGASWQTPSGSTNSVTITSTSQQLTDAEFNILNNNENSIIIYDNGTDKKYYRKSRVTSAKLHFIRIFKDIDNISKEMDIEVTISTKKCSPASNQLSVGSQYGVECSNATIGQVLGVVSAGQTGWINVGGSAEVIELSGSSGTLTDANFTKIQNVDTIIKIDYDYFIHTRTTSSHIIYDHFTYNASWTRVDNRHISINISTKAWTLTDNRIKQLYLHNIHIEKSGSSCAYFSIINDSSTAFTYSTLCSKLVSDYCTNQWRSKSATGVVTVNSIGYNIIGVFASNSTQVTWTYMLSDGTTNVESQGTISNAQFNDNVITL